jgi:hypothetical protein
MSSVIDGEKARFMERLGQLLTVADFEYGFSSSAEAYVRAAVTERGAVVREWINEVFLRSWVASPESLCRVLRVLGHLEYSEVAPQGPTMALASLRHADAEARECAVRCFENWGGPECAELLRRFTFDEDWLADYVRAVIADLEAVPGR